QTFDTYKNKYKIDLEEYSGAKHHLLPAPAVFIIGGKGQILFSTAILITKCPCPRRFFWPRPRPMPKNDPEGNDPDLKGLLASIAHMIRGGSRCLSRSRRVAQNNGVRILESVSR